MTRHFLGRLGVLALFGLLSSCGSNYTACHDQHDSSSIYAKKTYLDEVRHQDYLDANPRLDEALESENLLDIQCNNFGAEWERRPYETIEEWRDRIEEALTVNFDTLRRLRCELEELSKEHVNTSQTIKSYIVRNEELREIQQKIVAETRNPYKHLNTSKAPPFTHPLSTQRDTLRTIALRYYQDEEKIKDIMIWNQGWLRHEDEVIAGLGLVLFPMNAKETGESSVQKYLNYLNNNFKYISIEYNNFMNSDKKHVLLVDDDHDFTTHLKASLDKLDKLTVSTVDNAGSAIGALRQQHYDLVVTDVHMPQVSGLELSAAIRDEFPDTEVVILTAYNNEEDRLRAKNLNIDHYLTKPIQLNEVNTLLKEVLNFDTLAETS